ncbi:4'-phosphopantetheinyl transferase family protein [Paramaledivibacter caminithermalis]|jgi:4'-phosphopantetheinyl transferase|uniref:4'-phosphopantetheinyl transferase n=1 Tax=Paramaledivibacter caminithermalis (strain DSM 15212 / CIP 107654 / DViRD3) TaxID=1121301 RepID=A0A1M6QS90_PARC5|nr:4'-phosphopantetheinyl transferase superfamily protein [Paramaledivibacter caminithermalis]SHK23025.1 4'-phosphopantetheinyl transferase [Paramaledivibacter caminithermalis DSM 15212]
MIEIYATKINDIIEKSKYKKLLSYLSEERIKKINRLVRLNDKYRSLLGEILVRQIIINKFNMLNSDIKIVTNNYGKPYLYTINNFEFNISHSGDWVVCAIDESPIGIDIEKIQSINYLDIVERFFTKNECRFLNSKNEYEKLGYFFELWTLKESYIKAVGKGLSIPLNSFEISVIGDNIEVIGTNNKRYFKMYNIDYCYKLSVCSKNKAFPKKIVFKSFSEIFNDRYLLERKNL